jgi:hypothetical protein
VELAGLRKPRARHDPGRVLVDMAVAVADGATTISEVAVLADQAALFGPVASDSTCWRLLERLDTARLGAIGRARSAARELAWAQRAELSGEPFPPARAAGRVLPGLVIDLDASIVVCHSEKEQAAPTFKKTFGYHPMLAFCDNTGEFLAAQLGKGNAGSNTAADHIAVLDAALAQIPDQHRHGTPILVRADAAGCTREFLNHLRDLRDAVVSCEFSVGWAITGRERAAISTIPARVWADAVDADGGHRDGAGLAEITGVLPARALAGYPAGIRIIVRRERPHPGAQLDAFEEAELPDARLDIDDGVDKECRVEVRAVGALQLAEHARGDAPHAQDLSHAELAAGQEVEVLLAQQVRLGVAALDQQRLCRRSPCRCARPGTASPSVRTSPHPAARWC